MNEQFIPNPEEPIKEKVSEERTKETEIRAVIEFWKNKGVYVREKEVIEAIESLPEVEGINWYMVIPEDLTNQKVWGLARKIISPNADYAFATTINGEGRQLPRRYEKTYAIGAHYSEEPDEDSLGEKAKSPKEWVKTGKTFMNLLEKTAYDLRYNFESGNNDDRLDRKSYTMDPNARTPSRPGFECAPVICFSAQRRGFGIDSALGPDSKAPGIGIREIVTEDTPQEVIVMMQKEAEARKQ